MRKNNKALYAVLGVIVLGLCLGLFWQDRALVSHTQAAEELVTSIGNGNDDAFRECDAGGSGCGDPVYEEPVIMGINIDWFNNCLRFTGLGLTASDTINSAFFRFIAMEDISPTAINNKIFANDGGDSPSCTNAFVQYEAGEISESHANWNSTASWSADSTYDSGDFADVVQEVIGYGGWTSGNAISFFVDNNGSTVGEYYTAYSYDIEPTSAPELHINFTGAAGTPEFNTTTLLLTVGVVVVAIVVIRMYVFKPKKVAVKK